MIYVRMFDPDVRMFNPTLAKIKYRYKENSMSFLSRPCAFL
jgi:hypothetical protein